MPLLRLLLPLLLSTLNTDGLSEETQLLCKRNAISVGRAVERDLLVNLLESRLRVHLRGRFAMQDALSNCLTAM